MKKNWEKSTKIVMLRLPHLRSLISIFFLFLPLFIACCCGRFVWFGLVWLGLILPLNVDYDLAQADCLRLMVTCYSLVSVI